MSPGPVTASVVVGLDIGTTSSKAVAWPASGSVPASRRGGGPCAEQPTPWHTSGCGRTEIDAYRLVAVAASRARPWHAVTRQTCTPRS